MWCFRVILVVLWSARTVAHGILLVLSPGAPPTATCKPPLCTPACPTSVTGLTRSWLTTKQLLYTQQPHCYSTSCTLHNNIALRALSVMLYLMPSLERMHKAWSQRTVLASDSCVKHTICVINVSDVCLAYDIKWNTEARWFNTATWPRLRKQTWKNISDYSWEII